MHFVIVAPPFNAKIGGRVALYKLAHELDALGYPVCIWDFDIRADPDNFVALCRHLVRQEDVHAVMRSIRRWRFTEPPLTLLRSWAEWPRHNVPPDFQIRNSLPRKLGPPVERVVVYPEIVPGNPLNAKHVVRWLLHEPGFHHPQIEVCRSDYFVRYADWFNKFSFANMQLRHRPLTVRYIPDVYLESGLAEEERSGVVYTIHKGRANFQPDLVADGLCIDGLPHEEIAQHFRTAKRYISFDTRTFQTRLASLCGIETIVVPEPGVSSSEWLADPSERYGVAYGFSENELAYARETQPLMRSAMLAKAKAQSEEVRLFAEDCRKHFGLGASGRYSGQPEAGASAK